MHDRMMGGILLSGILAMALVTLSCASRRPLTRGLPVSKLPPCPDSPNCVCSEDPAADRRVAPLIFTNGADRAWTALRSAIRSTGGTVRTDTNGYIRATYTSRIFRFVDDLECRLDEPGGRIHLRSASRVGYSDLGANRRRLVNLTRRFDEEQLR